MAYQEKLDALGDSRRRAILEILARGPQSVASIAAKLPVSRPAVSQHLKKLLDSGLVERTPDGQRALYNLCRAGFDEITSYVHFLWDSALERFHDAANEQHEEESMERIEPVTKVIEVSLEPERAFELFTTGMDSWWPFETHSVYEAQKVAFEFQTRVGGQLIETGPEGVKSVWGTVDACDRPNRVAFSWHPGRDSDQATHVSVGFEALDSGGTRVTLVHSGWEVLGERAIEARKTYDSGWIMVFAERYGEAAAAAQT